MRQRDEFYIGWSAKSPPGIGRTVRMSVTALLTAVLVAAVVLARSQRTIGASAFEWGNHKTINGVLRARPYPQLLVPRPGNANGQSSFSTYYLVAVWKFGLPPEAVAPFDGKTVNVQGTLIYRDNETMIETRPDWIREATISTPLQPPSGPVSLGRQTLVGEIVDSKCYLGVMNPGEFTPHRACAIRCIRGGIPPVLVVRHKTGPPLYCLLISAEGKPVNRDVLDLVAEPVEITGEVVREGDRLILRADPATYRRTH
jgi:hypothetical protein